MIRHNIKEDNSAIEHNRNECLFPSIANKVIDNIKLTTDDIIKYHSTFDIERMLLEKINSNGFIFCNSGSECIIKQVIECLSVNNKQWVIPCPTFELTDFYCRHYKCKIERPLYVYNNYFSIDLEHILNTHQKILYIVSPHNPTGVTLSLEEIDNLCKKYKYVILDQAYMLPDEPIHSLNHKNLILIRSFSKMGLITGLRFGFGMCFDNKLLLKFNQIRPMYLNSLTLKFIEYILLNNITHKIKDKIDKEIIKFEYSIKDSIVSHAGNFVLFNNTIDTYNGRQLKQYNFNNKLFYRLTIYETDENKLC
jgi:histidinol-phosphate/aromatic aminotransferase/cobyric acid decarboxylase-like protein